MVRYRDPIIIFGAVICLVEFLAMDYRSSLNSATKGILHLMAGIVLLATLILYVSTFRMGWNLFLRIIFAGFVLVMLIYTFRLAFDLLTS
jgi:hypothetical protein